MSFIIPLPGTDEPFTIETLAPALWYHIYCTETHPAQADTFNAGWGQSRFAPFKDAAGSNVHTWYAASTLRSAMMESVLHDIPLAPPGAFQLSRLVDFHLATIKLDMPLQAVSFHSLHLPKHRLSRTLLIDSLPAYYPRTTEWAKAAYLQSPGAAAIMYCSRRDDAANCIMLFKDRLPDPVAPFTVVDSQPLSTPGLSAQFRFLIHQLGIAQSP